MASDARDRRAEELAGGLPEIRFEYVSASQDIERMGMPGQTPGDPG